MISNVPVPQAGGGGDAAAQAIAAAQGGFAGLASAGAFAMAIAQVGCSISHRVLCYKDVGEKYTQQHQYMSPTGSQSAYSHQHTRNRTNGG